MSTNENTLLSLDGASYDLESFSDEVKNGMAVFNAFTQDLQKEELAVIKTKAAMDTVRMQLVSQVTKEIKEKSISPVSADVTE